MTSAFGRLKMDTIPLELFSVIIGRDWQVYRLLTFALPRFGRSTLTTQDEWRAVFTRIVREDGWTHRLLADRLHCEDGPASISHDGCMQAWYKYGLLHRDDDKPANLIAYIKSEPLEEWYQHGKLHRDGDKPAITGCITSLWYQKGKLHRDGDLPAIVSTNGEQEWYQHGKRHRAGGKPALIRNDYQQWWVNDVRIWRDLCEK